MAVDGLRKGRADVRETDPGRPVADAGVEAIRPHVAAQVWAMVEIQRITGMRPGEVLQIQPVDIDRCEPVWPYSPPSHKTEHHGYGRSIDLGPKAQVILYAVARPWGVVLPLLS